MPPPGPLPAVPPTLAQPQPGLPPKRRSRTPLWAALGAVVVLGAAAVTGTMLRSDDVTPAAAGPGIDLPGAAPVPDLVPDLPVPDLPVPDLTVPGSAAGSSESPGSTVAEQVYEGTGDDVVRLREPVDLAILRFECPGCTRLVSVVSDSGIDRYVVQHYSGGPYSGKRWIGVRGDRTSSFEVTAQGPWRLTVGGVDLARPVDGTTTVTGRGDDVVIMRTSSRAAELTHTGEGNFVVHTLTDRSRRTGPDLLVNEIGRYSGTVALDIAPGEATLMQVSGDGDWTFTPR
jgi:hypothetical protein